MNLGRMQAKFLSLTGQDASKVMGVYKGNMVRSIRNE